MRIAIICGGPSRERGVSLNSARSVLDHLSCEDICVIPLYVDYQCQFYELSPSQLYSNTPADFDFKLDQMATKLDQDQLKSFFSNIDIAFPLIHGAFGEDGGLQALLEKWNIPYIASDSASCRQMFHKYHAAQILKKHSFPTLPSILLSRDQLENASAIQDFFSQHHLDRAIVKPASGGSSIGVSSVMTPEEAFDKCNDLLSKDTQEVLLEPFCKGIEFTVVVLENHFNEPVALIPTQIQTSYEDNAIFDYRKKYLPTSHTFYHTPPRFEENTIHQIRSQAEQLFKLFKMRDFVRMDGWLMPDNTIYITDLNPISGMEQNSFMFRQAAVIGMTHRETLQYVLQHACKRYGIPYKIDCQERQTDKQNVYVLFGGKSAERQVSLMSGANVWLKLIQSEHYTPTPFLLDLNREIWTLPYSHALNHTVEEVYANCLAIQLNEIRSLVKQIQHRLGIEREQLELPQKMSYDHFMKQVKKERAFVFIALHGGEGEDGTLQKMLEDHDLDFNGSPSISSALCMDKALTGEAISNANDFDILALPKKVLSPKALGTDFKQIWIDACEELAANQLIIKPRHDGCSAGIVLLKSAQDLERYCLFANNKTAMIPPNTFVNQTVSVEMPANPEADFILEPYIETDAISIRQNQIQHIHKHGWIELTVGIVEKQGIYHALNPSITVSEGAVLSLEEKFQGGTGINITPPPESIISAKSTQKIKHLIEKTAQLLGIKNYARIDIFFNRITEKIIVIEANTLPALTPSTVIYQQALAETPPLPPRLFLETIIASRTS